MALMSLDYNKWLLCHKIITNDCHHGLQHIMSCLFVQMAIMFVGLEHVSRIRTNGIGMDTIRASNSLCSDQLQQFVRADLSLNCLQRESSVT